MLIRIADLKGQIPRLHPRLLPSSYAQVAKNTRLEDGTIGPVKAPVTVHSFGTAPASFIKFSGSFVAFDQPNVTATAGPVAQDRLYFMGDGAPKMRVDGTDYDLAIQPPSAPPIVALASQEVGPAPTLSKTVAGPPQEGEALERFIYRYAATTSKGETFASPSAEISRIDGETVTLSAMALPSDTVKIRVYRLDPEKPSGASGRFGFLFEATYDVNTHGALGAATITDFFGNFPDVSQAPVEDGDFTGSEEVVTYVFTYVTSFDEESAPSPASDLVKVSPIDSVTFTTPGPVQLDRNIDRIRVYRSKTSLSGITDFYFLKEIASGDFGVAQTDSFEQQLNEPISSADYNPPEQNAIGLIPLPNGLMAAFRGREIMFSEPYQPHAWPIKYRLTTDTDIVGLGAFGTYVAVMTKGSPFIVSGSDPSLMTMEKLERTLPCLNRRSIVDLGYSIAYASTDGLVLVSQQGADMVSRNLFTAEQWRAMRPETFLAAERSGRYHFSYQPQVGGPRKFGIIDLSREQPYFIEADIEPTLVYFSSEDGALYYIEGDSDVKEFDPRGGAVVAKQTWRGKRTILTGFDNFGALLVETDPVSGAKSNPSDPDCTIRIYADGVMIHQTTDTNRATRLPSGFLAERWEIEIEGYTPVTAISLANDISELAGA